MLLVLRHLLISLIDAYSLVIFVYVIMSWIPHSSGVIGDVYRVLGKICDPYLNLFKKFIPPIGGVLDITPIFALLLLQIVARFL